MSKCYDNQNVTFKFISEDDGEYGYFDSVEAYVNGEKVAEGSYGGEPEDNTRERSYAWVERMLVAVVAKLDDVNVDVVNVSLDEEGNEIND